MGDYIQCGVCLLAFPRATIGTHRCSGHATPVSFVHAPGAYTGYPPVVHPGPPRRNPPYAAAVAHGPYDADDGSFVEDEAEEYVPAGPVFSRGQRSLYRQFSVKLQREFGFLCPDKYDSFASAQNETDEQLVDNLCPVPSLLFICNNHRKLRMAGVTPHQQDHSNSLILLFNHSLIPNDQVDDAIAARLTQTLLALKNSIKQSLTGYFDSRLAILLNKGRIRHPITRQKFPSPSSLRNFLNKSSHRTLAFCKHAKDVLGDEILSKDHGERARVAGELMSKFGFKCSTHLAPDTDPTGRLPRRTRYSNSFRSVQNDAASSWRNVYCRYIKKTKDILGATHGNLKLQVLPVSQREATESDDGSVYLDDAYDSDDASQENKKPRARSQPPKKANPSNSSFAPSEQLYNEDDEEPYHMFDDETPATGSNTVTATDSLLLLNAPIGGYPAVTHTPHPPGAGSFFDYLLQQGHSEEQARSIIALFVDSSDNKSGNTNLFPETPHGFPNSNSKSGSDPSLTNASTKNDLGATNIGIDTSIGEQTAEIGAKTGKSSEIGASTGKFPTAGSTKVGGIQPQIAATNTNAEITAKDASQPSNPNSDTDTEDESPIPLPINQEKGSFISEKGGLLHVSAITNSGSGSEPIARSLLDLSNKQLEQTTNKRVEKEASALAAKTALNERKASEKRDSNKRKADASAETKGTSDSKSKHTKRKITLPSSQNKKKVVSALNAIVEKPVPPAKKTKEFNDSTVDRSDGTLQVSFLRSSTCQDFGLQLFAAADGLIKIRSIDKSSPAATTILQAGWIVRQLNGAKVADYSDVSVNMDKAGLSLSLDYVIPSGWKPVKVREVEPIVDLPFYVCEKHHSPLEKWESGMKEHVAYYTAEGNFLCRASCIGRPRKIDARCAFVLSPPTRDSNGTAVPPQPIREICGKEADTFAAGKKRNEEICWWACRECHKEADDNPGLSGLPAVLCNECYDDIVESRASTGAGSGRAGSGRQRAPSNRMKESNA